MNPWAAGRIIEQMQVEARNRARDDRLVRQAMRARDTRAPAPVHEPRRERLGLAVARVGFRIAGHNAEPLARHPRFASGKLEATR
jgi:hypothetical protein